VPALQQALIAGGAEVAVAPSGSFALTMLEWNRQDVIISHAHIEDMEGHELCTMVKSDPSTRDVRFVLVARSDEVASAQMISAGIDLVIPADMSGSMIVTLVVQLMLRDRGHSENGASHGATASSAVAAAPTRPPPTAATPAVAPPPRPAETPARPGAPKPVAVPKPVTAPKPVAAPKPVTAPRPAAAAAPAIASSPAAAPKPATAPAAPTARRAEVPDFAALSSNGAKTFQGSLGVMEMEELTQAIAVGGKTGRLLLVLAAGGGMIAFESGRVVHAEFGDITGEAAFGALVSTSHQERTGKFCFIPGDALANIPRTIERSVDQLLLSIATTMDERGR
jgi:CheY-like chemotaxis protein